MNKGIVTYSKKVKDDLWLVEGYLNSSGRVFTAFSKTEFIPGYECGVYFIQDKGDPKKWYTNVRRLF